MGWDRKAFLSLCAEDSVWRFTMRPKVFAILGAGIALAWSVQTVRAGAIRFAAKQLHKGSITAVQRTSDAKGTAVANIENARKTTRTAVKNGTAVVRTDVASAPGAAVKETKTAAGRLRKAVW
jgi:short subunit dehydrogenase-like uncharacterized protein